MSEYVNRLKQFLEARGQSTEFTALTADASTREYYRIQWKGASAIGCVYPESFIPEEQNYIAATKLFLASHLPVAEIDDFYVGLGVIIQEYLGSTVLRDACLDSPKSRI